MLYGEPRCYTDVSGGWKSENKMLKVIGLVRYSMSDKLNTGKKNDIIISGIF